MSAPASSATSSVSRVDRPQILTSRDMFQDTGLDSDDRRKNDAIGRVLQRRALLVSPAGPIQSTLQPTLQPTLRRQGRIALRVAARGGGAATQIGQLRP